MSPRTSISKKTSPPPRERVRSFRKKVPPPLVPPLRTFQDEKQRLIITHTAQRRSMDPLQRVSLWVGVALCALFIAIAWFYTVGLSIKKSMTHPIGSSLQGISALTQDFKATAFQERGPEIQDLSQRLDALRQNFSDTTDPQLSNVMVNQMNTSTVATTSPPLFRPLPPSSSTTTSTTSSTAL